MIMNDSKPRIAVCGLWHLGLVYAAGWAELGHQVIGLCDSPEQADRLNQAILPIAEPGLSESVKVRLGEKSLHFTHEWSVIKDCPILALAFDTPVDDSDGVDLGPLQPNLINGVGGFWRISSRKLPVSAVSINWHSAGEALSTLVAIGNPSPSAISMILLPLLRRVGTTAKTPFLRC